MKKLVFLLHIIALAACQQQPNLRARCYARFMEEDNMLLTKIEIREIGQAEVAAIKVDEVRFNEGAMERRDNNVVGNYYQAEVMGGIPGSGFEYKIKHQKKQATIQFNVSGLKNYGVKDNYISKSSGFTLKWDGAPLSKNEEITVTLTDFEGTVAQAVVKGATAKNEAFIPAVMFSGLKAGNGSYFLVKSIFPLTQNDNIQSEAEVGYYSKSIAIEIKE
jgi:hypothetical protein